MWEAEGNGSTALQIKTVFWCPGLSKAIQTFHKNYWFLDERTLRRRQENMPVSNNSKSGKVKRPASQNSSKRTPAAPATAEETLSDTVAVLSSQLGVYLSVDS